MLIKAIALSGVLFFGAGAMTPMIDFSEAVPTYVGKHKKKRRWNVEPYSKKWWALYRKQERRKRDLLARRLLKARILAEKQNREPAQEENHSIIKTAFAGAFAFGWQGFSSQKAAILPSGESAPQNWKAAQSSAGEIQYRIDNESDAQVGQASLTVVGMTNGANSANGRSKTLGGISTADLRRTVIDKMMREDGWVVNDYQKELNGKKVYVVVAQSTVSQAVQSRLFYFTEVDGRIYSLATSAPIDSQERLAQECETVINSLQRNNRSVQAGLK